MKKEEFKHLSQLQETASLCWRLYDELDFFTGFEKLRDDLQNCAMILDSEFDKHFDDLPF